MRSPIASKISPLRVNAWRLVAHSWLLWFWVDIPASEGFSISEVMSSLQENVSLVSSASCQYSVAFTYPRENLLGVPLEADTHWIPAPLVVGEATANLPGIGWFSWSGGCAYSCLYQVHHSPGGSYGGLIPYISTVKEGWDGATSRQLNQDYAIQDDINSALAKAMAGVPGALLNKDHGIISLKPSFVGSLMFRTLALFTADLTEVQPHFSEFPILSEVIDEGANLCVRLTNTRTDSFILLDPEKGFMPVKTVIGVEGVQGMVREVEYNHVDAAWFPAWERTTYYSRGTMRYRVTCSMGKTELNAKLPISHFYLEFPESTSIEDYTEEPED